MSSWWMQQLAALLETFLRLPSFLPTSIRAGLLRSEQLQLLPLSVPAPLLPHALFLCSSEAVPSCKEGVPVHPLCKPLAHALCEWMAGTGFPRSLEHISGLVGEDHLEDRSKAWADMILQLLKRLQELMQQVTLHLQVQEPLFSELRENLADTFYIKVEASSIINDTPVKIQDSRFVWDTCSLIDGSLILLNDASLHKAKLEHIKMLSPHMRKTLTLVIDDHGGTLAVKNGELLIKDLDEEKEIEFFVSAMQLHYMPEYYQPLKIMESILEALSIEGVKALLGFRYTKGSITEALPPARSLLLSSFLENNSTDVAGATLTTGARALAKHVHRSGSGWWGPFSGNDEKKNEVALNKISYLIQHACWQNVHHMPPNSSVFEIRVKEGYGARWTADGTKFRGFLEPQMADGHEKRWRH